MLELTPSEAKSFIVNAIKIRKIPYIAGPAGIGKSDLNAQVADEFNLKLLDIRLSQKLPEDLTGMPTFNKITGKAEYVPFDTFPMEGDPIPEGYDGWLVFLDELSSASDEVWAAIYSLLLGHTVGGRRLHPKALITAAGNRASDSAIARELPDTLITRLLCANMKTSPKDWLIWAKNEPSFNQTVIDHISKKPDMLMSLIPSEKRDELESYGTPRGWETVSMFANMHEKNSAKEPIQKDLASGGQRGTKPIPQDLSHSIYSSVGFMEGKSFIEYFNDHTLIPYPWEVAQSPSSVKIPVAAIARADLTEELAKFFTESGAQAREALLIFMNRNDAESRAVFCELVKKSLGTTVSDLALLDDITKRLMIIHAKPDDPMQTNLTPVLNPQNTTINALTVTTCKLDSNFNPVYNTDNTHNVEQKNDH